MTSATIENSENVNDTQAENIDVSQTFDYNAPANINDIKQTIEEKNLETIPVIFRKWADTNEIIALFPTLVSSLSGYYCESFMLNGGHCAADYSYIIGVSCPVDESQYAKTKQVLENVYGYKLEVHTRRSSQMYDEFLAERTRLIKMYSK